MLALTMGMAPATATPHHRNHLKITTTAVIDTTQAQGVAAYSDTTAAQAHASAVSIDADDDDDADDLSDFNASILLLVFVVAVLIFLAFPFVVFIVLLRYLFKRSKARMELAQKAIETGQPIPENLCGKQAVPAADLWRTGIRNVSIGAGLVLMFAIWGSAFLVGIGALVLCYGVGQLVIVKTSAPADGSGASTDDGYPRDDHGGPRSDGGDIPADGDDTPADAGSDTPDKL